MLECLNTAKYCGFYFIILFVLHDLLTKIVFGCTQCFSDKAIDYNFLIKIVLGCTQGYDDRTKKDNLKLYLLK